MTTDLFDNFQSLFKKSILGDISHCNQHIIILNGHSSHIMIKINKTCVVIWFGRDHSVIPPILALQP
jgi:hypothetical protein